VIEVGDKVQAEWIRNEVQGQCQIKTFLD